MPELPDLEVFSHNLHRQLAGKTITRAEVNSRAKLNVPKTRLVKAITGNRIKKIYRDGKELHVLFTNKSVLALHMMLHGKLYWIDSSPAKYTLLMMTFNNNKQLGLADFQFNARISLDPEITDTPDALSAKLTASVWKEKLQSKAQIKKLLLDQHVVRGIGNAYADEILWEAGISPFSIASKIPASKSTQLLKAIQRVLKKAVKQIDKSVPGIIGGEVRDFLVIHNAHKKKSPTGAVIRIKVAGGRKTYYTDEQQLYK
jgi:formamidopyrimidine-DNA glycosylase